MGLLDDVVTALFRLGFTFGPGGGLGTFGRGVVDEEFEAFPVVRTLQEAGLLPGDFPASDDATLSEPQLRQLNAALIQARQRGIQVMPARDPQTGQFVSSGGKGGRPVESPELLVLDQKADVGTPYADWTDDEFAEGSYRVFELPVDEDEVMLIYGLQTWISDANELAKANPVQVWWWRGVGPVSAGDWVTKVDQPNFLAYHEFSIPPGGDSADGLGMYSQDGVTTNFWQEWGGPELNASGDLTVCTEYLGAGAEIAWGVWYESIEVSQEHLLEELLEQSRESLRGTRP